MMFANITLAMLKWLIAAFASGSLIGFAFRTQRIAKAKKRILELETEMVENHAEILRLHKIHADKSGNQAKVPVINLKSDQVVAAIAKA
ncbi:MAG TPA: hypothetical protein PLQ65_03185 [Flavihumibacter sp.]|nr:hypothetical protein [Flavihumibacter sp.]HQD08640.1 hypothetical protein [Flavihumibacter sp.]